MSGNVITDTWLAYALDRELPADPVRAALGRVEAHYGPQLAEPPPLRASLGGAEGIALWRHDDPSFHWPAWAEERDGGFACASSGALAGWERLVGDVPPERAALPLARALAERPERLVELTPPFVLGARDPAAGRLVIVNDFAGAGRIYELRFAAGESALGVGGCVWSNRLGALPIFAGATPEPDRHAWHLFAAAGWFLGDWTPIRGASKVPAGTALTITSNGAGAAVERRDTGAVDALVRPRDASFDAAVASAAEHGARLARNVDAVFDKPPTIDLSGGRDSRVSAACAVGGDVDARYRTGDNVPGELEVAKRLVEAAPRPMRHRVGKGGRGKPPDQLGDRIESIHLVHDGMRNPQELRRPTILPLPAKQRRPMLSGHGGEIAHGFYYTNARQLRRIESRGDAGVLRRLERAATRRAPAATDEAYELHRGELERILEQGRGYGLAGPTLLDWFYLAHRLAYRSGLGSRSGRYSCCVTPGFVRAAFDLTPAERLDARLHRELVAHLVPEWEDVPFFASDEAGSRMPTVRRARIWERPGHAEQLAQLIRSGGSWQELFQRRRVRKMWREVRKGRGHHHYETIFNRIVWREGFDRHLRTLAAAASAP